MKKIEISLLLALAVTLLWGAWSLQEQEALAQKMVRLHVIAASDSQEDQALKLQVRDAVVQQATAILRAAADREAAESALRSALPELEQTAGAVIRQAGYGYRVQALLEEAEFPHKEYEGFALPAGRYPALRIVIGEGKGQNWWCVVFPPLCTTAATDTRQTAVAAGLEERDLGLITEENSGYVLKFRSLELWEQLRQWLQRES